jgi:hypothetical protein
LTQVGKGVIGILMTHKIIQVFIPTCHL